MNYYYHTNGECFLIGEHTDNWAFSLVVNKFPNLQAWKEAFRVPGAVIKNSNYDVISPDDMEGIITFRKGNVEAIRNHISDYGSSVFHGPHDLICIKVGKRVGSYKCIANEGCWDLCRDDF